MNIEIGGVPFEIVIGTGISGRNSNADIGAFIELYAESAGPNPVLFAFRSNANGQATISMYRKDVPIEVLEYFLEVVRSEFANWPICSTEPHLA